MNIEKLLNKVLHARKRQSRESRRVLEGFEQTEAVSNDLDSIYHQQLAAAQRFLNENHNADLSHIQCLLQKMLPEKYYSDIFQLKEHQVPSIIYSIHGGQHLYAFNAQEVEQVFEKKHFRHKKRS